MTDYIRNSNNLSLDFTPIEEDNALQYTIDTEPDCLLQSFDCPSHYKEMILIIQDLRRQRHLALQNFEFTPPFISRNSLNFPTPQHIPTSKRSKYNDVNISSIVTTDYDEI